MQKFSLSFVLISAIGYMVELTCLFGRVKYLLGWVFEFLIWVKGVGG